MLFRTRTTLFATCLLLQQAFHSSHAVVIMESSGIVNRINLNEASSRSANDAVVTILRSPGASVDFFGGDGDDSAVSIQDTDEGVVVMSAPGATMASTVSTLVPLWASSWVAGSIILSGITEGDVEAGLGNTRHGRTLSALFSRRSGDSDLHQTLLVAVPDSVDESVVEEQIKGLFDAVAEGAFFDDLYELQILPVANEQDAKEIIGKAKEAATSGVKGRLASFSSIVSKLQSTSSQKQAPIEAPAVTEARQACRAAYVAQSRASRAQLSAWGARVSRGLLVESFGTKAESLLAKCLDMYAKATRSAAGLQGAADYRKELRGQLQGSLDAGLRQLFGAQVDILEKRSLKQFQQALLAEMNGGSSNTDNAAPVRSAAFAFESAVKDLEVLSLSLTRDRPMVQIKDRLQNALMTFPDSPQAKLKSLAKINQVASKQKKPSERNIDIGLDFVAMFRPDGFGSLQGFCGTQFGGSTLTVGVHNDADAPETIAQMGGVRPPFLRVQPKLRVDVEL